MHRLQKGYMGNVGILCSALPCRLASMACHVVCLHGKRSAMLLHGHGYTLFCIASSRHCKKPYGHFEIARLPFVFCTSKSKVIYTFKTDSIEKRY